MGCINSVPNVRNFSVIDNKMFDDKGKQSIESNEDDFVNGIMYIKNMQLCMSTSKYIEKLCFVLASYQEEQLNKVKSIIFRILSSKLAKTPAGQEFEVLANHISDVSTFYLECMHCIRKHAANNTTQIFNDVAKYIKTSVLFGYQTEC
jgi:hypothetical protein